LPLDLFQPLTKNHYGLSDKYYNRRQQKEPGGPCHVFCCYLTQLNFTASLGFTSPQIWHEHLYAPFVFATNTEMQMREFSAKTSLKIYRVQSHELRFGEIHTPAQKQKTRLHCKLSGVWRAAAA